MEKGTDGQDLALGCLLSLILLPMAVVVRGLVLSRLWLYFVVPLGASTIGVWHAVGLSGLVALMTANLGRKKEPEGLYWQALGMVESVVAALISWWLGWLVHLAM